MLDGDEVRGFFSMLAERCKLLFSSSRQLHYLGQRNLEFFRETSCPAEVDDGYFQAAFTTMELAVDQLRLHQIITIALQSHPECSFQLNEQVEHIDVTLPQPQVTTRLADQSRRVLPSDIVVNCLWENRDQIDRSIFAVPKPNLRIKCGLLIDPDPALVDSFTFVHGAYGDVVARNGASTYLCWYPVSMLGMVEDFTVPCAWQPLLSGNFPESLKTKLLDLNAQAFRRIFPALGDLVLRQVRAGVIVARGHEDIDRYRSELHFRKDPPIRQHAPGYFSIGTGKYTSAPANARRLLEVLSRQ